MSQRTRTKSKTKAKQKQKHYVRLKPLNLNIPSSLHEEWEASKGPDGDAPIRSNNGVYKKYQYGVRKAVEDARLSRQNFNEIYSWLCDPDCEVDKKKWMNDLRTAGIGNSSRGKNVAAIAKVTKVIANWVDLYNKHHKSAEIKLQPGWFFS